jgi:hypothetical protein
MTPAVDLITARRLEVERVFASARRTYREATHRDMPAGREPFFRRMARLLVHARHLPDDRRRLLHDDLTDLLWPTVAR